MEEKNCCAEQLEEREDDLCPCRKTRHRSEEEVKKLCNRLSRIEGQIRGIRRMLDESAYCPDILNQAAAASAALNAFSRELLSQHLRSCVVNDLREGKDETVDELLDTLQRMMK
jgi:DNA-binding FrmR family transcriptional regulator